MLTSIGEILKKSGINPACTPYRDVCEYTFDAGDFFAIEAIDSYRSNFSIFDDYESIIGTQNNLFYEKLAVVMEKIKKFKETSTVGNNEADKQLRNLRVCKKEIQENINARIQGYYADKREKYVLKYKNSLVANTYKNITQLIPELGFAKCSRLYEMPLFTRDIDLLKNALSLGNKDEVGVVGGPCLFGTDEMIIEVTHRCGAKYYFDFNTGKNCDDPPSLDIAEHFKSHASLIKGVAFENKKDRLTLQEYESLAYPMEIAEILNASFVFPIPDMSYKKYLESISMPLDAGLRTGMIEDFSREAHRISDLYLDLYYKLLNVYKLKRHMALHERDERIHEFYSKREIYFKNYKASGSKHLFSSKTGKEEPVYDYISVLAAPFYFWNTKNVVQIDSLDETDSMRKCSQIHKDAFNHYAIMYPEIISKNGVDTIFYAKREHKIYV